MSREAMVWNTPTVKIATTQAGLDAAPTLECQITSAVLTPAPVYQTLPATGCAGASQSPGTTGWSLALAWLQDWSKTPKTDSLSWFAWDNDAKPVWVRIIPDKTAATQLAMEGQFFATSGGFGATFGDGSGAQTTASWPAVERPDIDPYTPPAPAATGVTAGTPATLTPSGATWTSYATLAALKADPAIGDAGTAKPTTAWASGEVTGALGDASTAHWSGTAWAAGAAT